ncbi:MAG: TrmB family transcriptional regulator [Candidatus Kariarchaeaceae archaeon]|jgi:sugar-specific transcriptional regulator TrmB
MTQQTREVAIDGLVHLGLPSGEAKSYVALVEIGSSEATPLAQLANVPQPKIYSYLKSLEQRGFVYKTHIRGKPNLYKPKSYSLVIDTLKESFDEKIDMTSTFLRDAEEMQELDNLKDYITYTQGKKAVDDGVKEIIQDLNQNCLIIDLGFYGSAIKKKIQARKNIQIISAIDEMKSNIETMCIFQKLMDIGVFKPIEPFQPLILFSDVDFEKKVCKNTVIIAHSTETDEAIIVQITHEVITTFQLRLLLNIMDIIKKIPEIM